MQSAPWQAGLASDDTSFAVKHCRPQRCGRWPSPRRAPSRRHGQSYLSLKAPHGPPPRYTEWFPSRHRRRSLRRASAAGPADSGHGLRGGGRGCSGPGVQPGPQRTRTGHGRRCGGGHRRPAARWREDGGMARQARVDHAAYARNAGRPAPARRRAGRPGLAKDQQPEYARNPQRSIRPEVFVTVGICTHLGCSPTAVPAGTNNPSVGDQWQGGFFCPCHGSTFDLAGRVFKNKPAPTNLEVPPHRYVSDTRLLIGDDAA